MSAVVGRVERLARQLPVLWAAVDAPGDKGEAGGRVIAQEDLILDAQPVTMMEALLVLAMAANLVGIIADRVAMEGDDELLERASRAAERAVRYLGARLDLDPFAVLGGFYGREPAVVLATVPGPAE